MGPRGFLVFLSLLLAVGLASGQRNTSIRAGEAGTRLTENDLPTCGRNCFNASIGPHCDVKDTQCHCQSDPLLHDIAECLARNCTMQEALDTSRVQASLCGLEHSDKSREGTVVISSVAAVASLAVLLRLLAAKLTGRFLVEDLFIVLAMAFVVPMLVPTLINFQQGFGRHLYDLRDGALTAILRDLFIAKLSYIASYTLVKVSILTFYLRVFRHRRGFRVLTITVLVTTLVASIIIFVLTILSCQPVDFFWDKDIKGGHCIDTTALAAANFGLASAEDVVIIIMPLLVVSGLKTMPPRKKLYVCTMFLVGFVAVVATIVRIQTLVELGDKGRPVDPSWDYVPITYWTGIELAAGVLVSSMPSLRRLVREVARRFGLHVETEKDDEFLGGNGGAVKAVVTKLTPERGYQKLEQNGKTPGVAYPVAAYCHPAFDPWEELDLAESGGSSSNSSSKSGSKLNDRRNNNNRQLAPPPPPPTFPTNPTAPPTPTARVVARPRSKADEDGLPRYRVERYERPVAMYRPPSVRLPSETGLPQARPRAAAAAPAPAPAPAAVLQPRPLSTKHSSRTSASSDLGIWG